MAQGHEEVRKPLIDEGTNIDLCTRPKRADSTGLGRNEKQQENDGAARSARHKVSMKNDNQVQGIDIDILGNRSF